MVRWQQRTIWQHYFWYLLPYLVCSHNISQHGAIYVSIPSQWNAEQYQGPPFAEDLMFTYWGMRSSTALSKICQPMARPTWLTISITSFWHRRIHRDTQRSRRFYCAWAATPRAQCLPRDGYRCIIIKAYEQTANAPPRTPFVGYLVVARIISFRLGFSQQTVSLVSRAWGGMAMPVSILVGCLVAIELHPGESQRHAQRYDARRCRAHPLRPV